MTKLTTKRDSLESLLNSEHLVEIEKMAIGGDGVARIPFDDKSLVVFVGKSAPGDQLKIKITAVEKNYLNGIILQIMKPGDSRREPPCIYANRCGGCSWQQLTEDEQIHQKELLLKELFKKFLPLMKYDLLPTVRSPKSFHYRNRIQLKHQDNLLGYFQEKSHHIVDIDACLIADQRISDEIPNIKQSLKPSGPSVVKYELKISEDNVFGYNRIGEKGQGLSFAQVNTEMNTLLQNHITNLVTAIQPKTISELYAGAGNFTIDLAKKLPLAQIEAAELNPELTIAAVKKLTELKLQKRLSFFTADCDAFVKRRPLSQDLILVDPPRQGCSEVVIDKIAAASTKNFLYISCHPVSLLRDLQKLRLEQSGYQIVSLQIYDMFPQTDHFETVILLTKA